MRGSRQSREGEGERREKKGEKVRRKVLLGACGKKKKEKGIKDKNFGITNVDNKSEREKKHTTLDS